MDIDTVRQAIAETEVQCAEIQADQFISNNLKPINVQVFEEETAIVARFMRAGRDNSFNIPRSPVYIYKVASQETPCENMKYELIKTAGRQLTQIERSAFERCLSELPDHYFESQILAVCVELAFPKTGKMPSVSSLLLPGEVRQEGKVSWRSDWSATIEGYVKDRNACKVPVDPDLNIPEGSDYTHADAPVALPIIDLDHDEEARTLTAGIGAAINLHSRDLIEGIVKINKQVKPLMETILSAPALSPFNLANPFDLTHEGNKG